MIFVCLHQPNVTAKTKLAGIENALPSVEGIYFYICLLYFVIDSPVTLKTQSSCG